MIAHESMSMGIDILVSWHTAGIFVLGCGDVYMVVIDDFWVLKFRFFD